ncbi:MAG: hypothetical protein EBT03_02645 [Betaproteobacteria bacterium]|nr:hypothetical protein [Betaproteobacteria bacterium]NBT74463.1 hypothetical protein [Betaproteobacteria bacterium]NBY13793.1 hypothetical protein [Betaproteobacteria bacterium]NDF03841.1 hypothetical protein [Betaproteobacteria bacterium]
MSARSPSALAMAVYGAEVRWSLKGRAPRRMGVLGVDPSGPRRALLGQLLESIGEDVVRVDFLGGEDVPNVLIHKAVLVFGDELEAPNLPTAYLPPLEAIVTPEGKRTAWEALARLKRAMRTEGSGVLSAD